MAYKAGRIFWKIGGENRKQPTKIERKWPKQAKIAKKMPKFGTLAKKSMEIHGGLLYNKANIA
ncbi:MAG: hypothetical protein IKS10_01680 [Lachnospiraceae bacterium]|nr:hypothetical protein [Lachnospiraceae bacterium]